MDEFKNNKEGMIGELKVRFFLPFSRSLLVLVEDQANILCKTESLVAETCNRREDIRIEHTCCLSDPH